MLFMLSPSGMPDSGVERKKSFKGRDSAGGSGNAGRYGGIGGSGGAEGSSGPRQSDKNRLYRPRKSYRRSMGDSPGCNNNPGEAYHTPTEPDSSDESDYSPVDDESDFSPVNDDENVSS